MAFRRTAAAAVTRCACAYHRPSHRRALGDGWLVKLPVVLVLDFIHLSRWSVWSGCTKASPGPNLMFEYCVVVFSSSGSNVFCSPIGINTKTFNSRLRLHPSAVIHELLVASFMCRLDSKPSQSQPPATFMWCTRTVLHCFVAAHSVAVTNSMISEPSFTLVLMPLSCARHERLPQRAHTRTYQNVV